MVDAASLTDVPTNQHPAPNAWRVYDSEGEHVYTVYSLSEAQALVSAHAGWTYSAVSIKDPRW